jgi:hypothetical protein
MPGLFITLFFVVFVTTGGLWVLRSLASKAGWELDPAESVGVAGLLALGAVGTLTGALGMIPGGLRWAMPLVGGAAVVLGIVGFLKGAGAAWKFVRPEGNTAIFPLVLGLLAIFPLIAALSPSTMIDWDSIAYHMAVPKLWLESGQVERIYTIHHSNFPSTINALYLYGLTWGDQFGAKGFSWAILILGAVALFGLSRRWAGPSHAWWAPLAFMASPVVLWESGTAYIDVAHGLFTGLAVLYTGELLMKLRETGKTDSLLTALALLNWGFTLGTKFTGLQTFAAAGLLALLFAGRKLGVAAKPVVAIALGAVIIASPWFIKNVASTGNPVFPFFYEKLGGSGWDQFRADIYRNEQQTFGVGRDPVLLGHAMLGLGYQPGRYVNPGQTQGAGFPTGAIGIAALAALVLAATSGRRELRISYVLAWSGLSLLFWFFLSQQSRYLTFLVVPSAVLVPMLWPTLRLAPLLGGLVGLQAAYTAFYLNMSQTTDQLRVLTGQVSPDRYEKERVGFASAAKVINENTTVTKVALFDEVFGFFLEKPYFWANPGHSDQIKFERIGDGAALAEEFRRQGISHAYMNFAFSAPEERSKWLSTAGLVPETPYSQEERARMLNNREINWKVLLADAVARGELSPDGPPTGNSILLKVN